MRLKRLTVVVAALAALALPAILEGEVLYLRDGSEIRGKLVSFDGDTLVFAPSFGGRVVVHRREIVRLVFDESAAPEPSPARETAGQEGPGSISVVFKDDELTSKIASKNKTRAEEEILKRASWIEQLFVVGSDTVYSRVDTTLDKTIYKGHEKEFKNTIRLEQMQVTVEPGVHRCVLFVRNVGAKEFEDAFTEGPLDLALEFKTVGVYSAQSTTLRVAIDKGFLRMGTPKLVPAE